MKKIVVFVSVVFVTQFSFSQKTTFKQDLIKFFEVAGTSPNELQNYFLSMIDASKHEDFKKELAVLLEDFYTKSAEVYQEEFSQAEIKELTSLSEKTKASGNDAMLIYSDVGKKFREKRDVLDSKLQTKLTIWQSNLDLMLSKYIDMSKYMELEVEAVEVESDSYGGSGQGTGGGSYGGNGKGSGVGDGTGRR